MNAQWIREQFAEHKAEHESKCINGIVIEK